MKKILIALDATDEADEVLKAATSLEPRGTAEYQIITVIAPLMGGMSGMDGASFAASWPLRDMEETVAQETLRNIRERAAAFGIDPEQVSTRIGRPASEIRAHAERMGADLIVMGSRGRHGLPGVLLGSTANAVLHGASCNTLTVRIGRDGD